MESGFMITTLVFVSLCQQVSFNFCKAILQDGTSSDIHQSSHDWDHGSYSHGGRNQSNLSFTLQQIYGSDYFKRLSTSDKILLIELLASAEVDQITNLLNTIGFSQILALIDDLTAVNVTVAHSLEKYIATELKEEAKTSSSYSATSSFSYTHSLAASSSSSSAASSYSSSSSSSSSSTFRYLRIITRKLMDLAERELQSFLSAMQSSSSYPSLSQTKKDLLIALIKAAESGSVNRFVQHVGYFNVIELIAEFNSADDTHKFISFLIDHLNSESHHTVLTNPPPVG